MPAEHKTPDAISRIHKAVDQARNEKQKSVLLQEAARLSQGRSSRAQARSREIYDEVRKTRSARKRA